MTKLLFADLPKKTVPYLPGFGEFYGAYPRKVKPIRARIAYLKARKIASHEEIMAGLERYKRSKPDYCDWAHPSTWLNDGRWEDEYDTPMKVKNSPENQSLENAAWKIRHGTSGGYQLDVTREQALACIEKGLVTEEQAKPWL